MNYCFRRYSLPPPLFVICKRNYTQKKKEKEKNSVKSLMGLDKNIRFYLFMCCKIYL